MIPKCVSKFLRQRENLVEVPCCNLEIYLFSETSCIFLLYFLVIFEFTHFCKILENVLINFFDIFTSCNCLYQESVVKMFLRLITWNINPLVKRMHLSKERIALPSHNLLFMLTL